MNKYPPVYGIGPVGPVVFILEEFSGLSLPEFGHRWRARAYSEESRFILSQNCLLRRVRVRESTDLCDIES